MIYMNGRLFGVVKRLSLVLGVILSVHVAARLFWVLEFRNDMLDTGTSSYDCNHWQYLGYSVRPDGCNTVAHLWSYHPNGWGEVLFDHFIGVIVTVVLAVVVVGLYWLIGWIINGSSDYVDPCEDNANCPCPRHREEERERAAARTAAIAASTAAVTTTIINN
jgi:hypothetical protein